MRDPDPSEVAVLIDRLDSVDRLVEAVAALNQELAGRPTRLEMVADRVAMVRHVYTVVAVAAIVAGLVAVAMYAVLDHRTLTLQQRVYDACVERNRAAAGSIDCEVVAP